MHRSGTYAPPQPLHNYNPTTQLQQLQHKTTTPLLHNKVHYYNTYNTTTTTIQLHTHQPIPIESYINYYCTALERMYYNTTTAQLQPNYNTYIHCTNQLL